MTGVLSARKPLLQMALFSLTESMRNDPDKYCSLIYYNNSDNRSSSDTDDNTSRQRYYYHFYMHREKQRQQYYPSHHSYIEACEAMLLEENFTLLWKKDL